MTIWETECGLRRALKKSVFLQLHDEILAKIPIYEKS